MRKIACTIKSWHGRAITLALPHDEYIYIGNLSVDFSEKKKKEFFRNISRLINFT